MMKTSTLVVVSTALMMLASVPTASADLVSVSGQCYNENASAGGGGQLGSDDPAAFVPQAIPTVFALYLFGTESVNDGSTGNACKRYDCNQQEVDARSCQGPNGREGTTARQDYLAVHVLDRAVEVCYNGSTDVVRVGDPKCREEPNGPGGVS